MIKESKRGNIKSRLVKHAADLWGYQQIDIDGFDPLVDLLFGGCAVEFEKIENQIKSSHTRTLEKLAELLLPEGLTLSQPAHLILKAKCVEPQYTLSREDQFMVDKEIISPTNPAELEKKTITFSPAIKQPIYNASLDYICFRNQLYKQQSFNLRESLAHTIDGKLLPENHIWFGISVLGKPKYLPTFSFFFDWKINPDKREYLDLLKLTQWSLNGEISINHKTGYVDDIDKNKSKDLDSLIMEWEVLPKIERKVCQYYEHKFISFKNNDIRISEQLRNYPQQFNSYFDISTLDQLKKPLIWIKLEVPGLIPASAFYDMECELNCFPSFNSQLIDNRRPFRMDEDLSIIPLKTEDYFLSMNKVKGDVNKELRAVPFHKIHDLEKGTYTIRKNSIGRFESRNAKEMLQYLLELIRDENTAFTALGGTISSREIEEMSNKLLKIELNLNKKSIDKDVTHYLMLQPGKNKQVYISYWNTCGSLANRIPADSPFTTKSIDIKSDSVISITTSNGGKDKPSEIERIHTFRSSLLSRERLVTKQDLVMACYAELGNTINKVTVQKGYKLSSGIHNGVVRTIEVFLSPENSNFEQEEWDHICKNLSSVLETKSSLMMPIVVKLAPKD